MSGTIYLYQIPMKGAILKGSDLHTYQTILRYKEEVVEAVGLQLRCTSFEAEKYISGWTWMMGNFDSGKSQIFILHHK